MVDMSADMGIGLDRLDRGVEGRIAGHHDHHCVLVGLTKLAQHLQAIEAGHLDVSQDQLKLGLLHPGQRLITTVRDVDLIPFFLQKKAQELAHPPLIIHDQDTGLC